MQSNKCKTPKVIVTAGGLSEPIDSVRAITNSSTGRLGALIATKFVENGAEVTYIRSKSAPKVKGVSAEIIVQTAEDLAQSVKDLLSDNSNGAQYDVFVHSMAVSDYEVSEVLPAIQDSGKLPSNLESVTLKLAPTPKVISMIKEFQPKITLIGFKLMVGVSVNELTSTAHTLCVKNRCEFVVANRLEDIDDKKHIAYIVDKGCVVHELATKDEIADWIVNCTHS